MPPRRSRAFSGPPCPSEQGATAVEYALLIALVAAVIFAAVAGLGGQLPGLYDRVCPAFGC